MFDSPFVYCPQCGEMVLLDQTVKECAREHGCAREQCPLAAWFQGDPFPVIPPRRQDQGEQSK